MNDKYKLFIVIIKFCAIIVLLFTCIILIALEFPIKDVWLFCIGNCLQVLFRSKFKSKDDFNIGNDFVDGKRKRGCRRELFPVRNIDVNNAGKT